MIQYSFVNHRSLNERGSDHRWHECYWVSISRPRNNFWFFIAHMSMSFPQLKHLRKEQEQDIHRHAHSLLRRVIDVSACAKWWWKFQTSTDQGKKFHSVSSGSVRTKASLSASASESSGISSWGLAKSLVSSSRRYCIGLAWRRIFQPQKALYIFFFLDASEEVGGRNKRMGSITRAKDIAMKIPHSGWERGCQNVCCKESKDRMTEASQNPQKGGQTKANQEAPPFARLCMITANRLMTHSPCGATKACRHPCWTAQVKARGH